MTQATSEGLLDGRAVLITGAARGMGRAHAIRAAREGADVALVDLPASADALRETRALVEREGRRAFAGHADVRDLPALETAATAAVETLGRLDGLVANAGIAPAGAPLWEIDPAAWQQVIDVNLTGTFHTCRAVVPHLLAHGRDASIVLIGSTAGLAPLPFVGHYNAAKAGVRLLSATLANELGACGVRCNAVLPGSIDTPMTDDIARRAGVDRSTVLGGFLPLQLLDGIIGAGDVSEAVIWLLSSQARFVTGQELCVDGGLTARSSALPAPDPTLEPIGSA